MKKLSIIILFFTITNYCSAQNNPGRGMPPYRILKTDGMYATPANLKKKCKTLLIYFSPDCSHCQKLTKELTKSFNQIKDVQIIMITWSANYNITAIKNFAHDYNLKKYGNFTIGTEGYSYVVMQYFMITTTPFVAVYSSVGKLTKTFNEPPAISDVLAAIKKAG